MPLPQINVTPGTGAVINTLPPGGQAPGASSLPVVIASDQPAVPINLVQGTAVATISASHAGDEQLLSSGNSLLVNSVGSILGPAGKADVQRGTGFDGVPAAGVPAGAQQFAVPINTTLGAAVLANSSAQSVLVGSTTNFKVGSFARISAGLASQEDVYVSAVTDATHFTAIFTKAHSSGDAVQTFYYNQARDASVGDKQPLTGFSASATFLWNTQTGLLELDRSAAGELDGASGSGTAVAAEYEFNGGGPILASGLASGFSFDRARSVQGKGLGSGTITASVAGNTAIVFGSSGATNLIIPGGVVRLRGGAVMETVYVSPSFVPGSSATVPLQSPVVNAGQTTAEWGVFATNGPGLNGFIADGIGIEEEALWDPVSNLFYIERAATQDAMPAANIVAESPALWNGATMDRWKGQNGSGQVLSVGGGSINTGQVSIGATATLLVAARANRLAVTIINEGSVLVRVGTSAVTTGTGAMLPASSGAALSLSTGAAIYGIVASGTNPISFVETF